MLNAVMIEVVGDASVATADAPESPLRDVRIESDSKDVARFLRRWNDRLEATARYWDGRNRDVLADPKPEKVHREFTVYQVDHEFVACPACNGEGYFLCDTCDGEGRLTKVRADAWRNHGHG